MLTTCSQPLPGRFLSRAQFNQAISSTQAADTFKEISLTLIELASLLPAYYPMVAVIEYYCDPVDRALIVSTTGYALLGFSLALLFAFLLAGLKEFAGRGKSREEYEKATKGDDAQFANA